MPLQNIAVKKLSSNEINYLIRQQFLTATLYTLQLDRHTIVSHNNSTQSFCSLHYSLRWENSLSQESAARRFF